MQLFLLFLFNACYDSSIVVEVNSCDHNLPPYMTLSLPPKSLLTGLGEVTSDNNPTLPIRLVKKSCITGHHTRHLPFHDC